MKKYGYKITYQDCCSSRLLLKTKAEFFSVEEAQREAERYISQNYPEMDRYHFKIEII